VPLVCVVADTSPIPFWGCFLIGGHTAATALRDDSARLDSGLGVFPGLRWRADTDWPVNRAFSLTESVTKSYDPALTRLRTSLERRSWG
jgi:hypothetical protein